MKADSPPARLSLSCPEEKNMIDRSSIKIEAKGILRTARVSPLLVAAVVIAVLFYISNSFFLI